MSSNYKLHNPEVYILSVSHLLFELTKLKNQANFTNTSKVDMSSGITLMAMELKLK